MIAGNRSRGTVPIYAAERGSVSDNALSPKNGPVSVRPVNGYEMSNTGSRDFGHTCNKTLSDCAPGRG